MEQVDTILVPVDFSERSIAAAEHAAALAMKFGSKLILAHVVPRPAYEYAAFEGGAYVAEMPTEAELAEAAETRLDDLIKKAGLQQTVSKLVLFGQPADEIVRRCSKGDIDLVVMPTHGYGLFRRFILGSVTTKVLHDVGCPVLTGAHVPEIPSIAANPYTRVACAVDLSEHSKAVIQWAADFAKVYGAQLTIVHAVPELTTGAPYGEWYPPSAFDDLIRTGREQTEAMLAELGCEAAVHVASGGPPRVVRDFIEESDAEMLIVGRSSGASDRLRTNAYAIIRESPCPVISV